jgi:hypothetical protein
VRLSRRTRRAPAHSAPPLDPAYTDLCWLLRPVVDAPADGEQVVLAELLINAGRLVLRPKSITGWCPAEQDMKSLAQIELAGSDVQLLFACSADTLDLTRLRFGTDAKAQTFVAHLIDGYKRCVGTDFPQGWLNASRPSNGPSSEGVADRENDDLER